jgi:cytokinin riboside 5'-monophosphate phosphoribohydrolase
MIRSVCVFSSSSDAVAPHYMEAASALGALMAEQQLTLVYGGGKAGLMGAVARAVHANGGKVVGVIPHYLRKREVAYEDADELIVTKCLRERKAIMEERADAFVALPGGFGTLEEILEILTLKQLEAHGKPVVFLNTNGFFEPLLAMFERLYHEQFTKRDYCGHYHIANVPSAVLKHFDGYCPPPRVHKWFEPGTADERG